MLPDRFILRRDAADANKDGNHRSTVFGAPGPQCGPGWQEALTLAILLAGSCHAGYLKARPKVRTRFNQAVLEAVYVKDRQLQRVEFTEVFEALFSRPSSNKRAWWPQRDLNPCYRLEGGQRLNRYLRILAFALLSKAFAWTLLDSVGQLFPKRAAPLLHARGAASSDVRGKEGIQRP
jgi:hypothetical protein